MGKASSSKKISRAARAGGGRRARSGREWMFPTIITVVVALGVILIVVANATQEPVATDVPPRAGGVDHFHEAYGFFTCDKFSSAVLQDQQGDRLGIHTHGDGVIHIHPSQPASAGKNAKLKLFMEETGLKLDDDQLGIPGQKTYKEGRDECGGKDAIVQVARWESPTDTKPEIITKDFGDIPLNIDRGVMTIAFAPEGTKLPMPPSVPTLDNLSDVPGGGTQTVPPSVPSTGEGVPSSTTKPSRSSTSTKTGGSSTSSP